MLNITSINEVIQASCFEALLLHPLTESFGLEVLVVELDQKISQKVIHPAVEDNPDIVPKVHHLFGIRVIPVDSGQAMLCRITTGDNGRQRGRCDRWENADAVWVKMPCSGKFCEMRQPACFQGWDKDPGGPAVNNAKEHFLQGEVLKRIFMEATANTRTRPKISYPKIFDPDSSRRP
jgi:hypothetical protein